MTKTIFKQDDNKTDMEVEEKEKKTLKFGNNSKTSVPTDKMILYC